MEVINQTPFHFACIAGRLNFPGNSLTLIIKGTFDLKPDQTAEPSEEQLYPTGDDFYPDDEEMQGSPIYDSDFAYFKPRADLLLVGKCHVPGGKTSTACQVTFQVGEKSKSLVVFGDRYWKRALGIRTISQPEPFKTMEIRYENSFGGKDYKYNPVGKGYRTKKTESGKHRRLLPNIEDPDSLIDSLHSRPKPVGYGPIGRMWAQRFSKMGTYKGNWLKERWPWFPTDFDWGYFNAAPPAMQMEGYLRGNETLSFKNLHPQHSRYRSRLPGLKLRCFVNKGIDADSGETCFSEVSMKLDTLWVDMEAEKMVLVWRGWTEVLSEDYEELAHVFILSEPLEQHPQTLDQYYQLFLTALAEYEREWEMAPEKPEPPIEPIKPEAAAEPATAPLEPPVEADAEKITQKQKEAFINKIEAQTTAILSQFGIHLDALPPHTQQKIKEQQTGILNKLTQEDSEKVMEEQWKEMEARMAADLFKKGIDIDHLPPLSDRAKAEQLRFMQEFGIDGSEIMEDAELSKMFNIMGAIMPQMGLDPENLTPLIENAKKYLRGIKEQLGVEEEKKIESIPEGKVSVLTRETVKERAEQGESFADEDLRNLDLSDLDLQSLNFTGTNLSGACLQGSNLSGAILESADLSGAVLIDAVLINANLSGAKLTGANLTNADLCGANLSGASLSRANLTGARLQNSNLENVDGTQSNLTEADLTGTNLTDAVFEKSEMARALLDGVEAQGAYFTESNLNEAGFKNSNLSQTDFSKCSLHKANFEGANLSEANIYAAQGTHINFRKTNLSGLRAAEGCNFSKGSFVQSFGPGAILQEAVLTGADFSFAHMEGADFTKASLDQAVLYAADLKYGCFIKASLRQAKLVRMNLFEGSFEKADLTDADLSGSNFYGAEFLDAILKETKLEGANVKMTKLAGKIPRNGKI